MTPRAAGAPRWPASARPLAAWSAAGLAVALAALAPPSPLASLGPLALLVAWVALEDLARFTLPDAALAAIGAIAALELTRGALFAADPVLAAALFALEGAVCGGGVWLVREIHYRRRGQDGVGFGDVKLAGVGGLLCGVAGFSCALLAASLAGLALAGVAGRLRPGGRPDRLAFGALLAPACLAARAWGAGP